MNETQLELFDPGPHKRREDGPDDRMPWWVWVLAGIMILAVTGGLIAMAWREYGGKTIAGAAVLALLGLIIWRRRAGQNNHSGDMEGPP